MRTATAPSSPPSPPGSLGEGTLVGTRTLIRLALRRDRVRVPVWLGSITLFTMASAVTFPETYPTAADRAAAATSMELPASVAMLGPNYAGPENYTYGPMIAHQMLVMTAVIVGVMSILLLVRHARSEEEAGRAELVRASIVGRHAPMAAALTEVGAANVVLALLIAASLGATGLETVTWEGSLLYGGALGVVGLVFAGVAALTVQVSEHARGASGMAMAALGAAYAVRAAGDVGDGSLTWLSPIGWAQQTRAFVDDRWWPLLPALALAAVLVVVASVLSSHRDVGAGLRPQRPGPSTASTVLASPLGHALRLQRASLIGWGVAVLLLGAMYGSFLGGVEDLIGDLEAMEDMLPDIAGADLTAAFVSMITTVVAMVCSIQAVLAVLRLRSEESAGRAEPLLATGLSRERWAAGHLTIALVGGALVLLVAGLGLGLAGAVATADGDLVWRALGAAVAHVPAVWVTVGVAMALFGLAPRAALAAWAVVVYSFLVVYLGGFLQFPTWMSNLSPFGHVPQLPAEDLRLTPLVVLSVIAAALVAAGLVGLRRRDLRSPA